MTDNIIGSRIKRRNYHDKRKNGMNKKAIMYFAVALLEMIFAIYNIYIGRITNASVQNWKSSATFTTIPSC